MQSRVAQENTSIETDLKMSTKRTPTTRSVSVNHEIQETIVQSRGTGDKTVEETEELLAHGRQDVNTHTLHDPDVVRARRACCALRLRRRSH